MCSPQIMAKVAEEISRRNLLKTAGMTGLAAGALSVTGFNRAARAQDATPGTLATPIAAMTGPFSTIIDLTHTWGPDFPMFPGAAQPSIEVLFTVANGGYYKNTLTLDEHTGTHMDSPAHFDEDGLTADLLPIENFIAPLVVVDVTERAASDPDTQGTPDDILAWESANGPLPEGAFVALYSGWETRVNDPEAYINLDADGVQHYPGWHPEAASLLVNERTIVGVGVDTLSLDYGASTDFGTHLTVLPAGKFGLENLALLGSAPATGAWIIVGGPKHERASGGPTRAFAVM